MNKPANNWREGDGAVWRFMVFLAVVFLSQGISQLSGVVSQPLTYFLKEALHFQPDQVTRYLSVLTIPWIIKPVYGLISDKLPIRGLKRKPYLFLANAMVVIGYLWMTGLATAPLILTALFVITLGMAVASTITEAVLVENGSKWNMSGRFVNQQWLWFNVASIGSSLGGGYLAQHFSAGHAFHTAALIAAVTPIAVIAGIWLLVDEKPETTEVFEKVDWGKLWRQLIGTKQMWIAAMFLAIWNIVPSFGTPLYYRMTDELHYGQQFIGYLGAIGSVGSVLGGLLYTWLGKRLRLSTLLYIAVGLGALSQASYVFMGSETSAVIISLAGGIIGMLALVSSLTVAAHASPAATAGFSYAILMSINNLSGQVSNNIGAALYVHVFHHHLNPVILIAAVGTLICAAFIPMLKLGDAGGNAFMKRAPKLLSPAKSIGNERIRGW